MMKRKIFMYAMLIIVLISIGAWMNYKATTVKCDNSVTLSSTYYQKYEGKKCTVKLSNGTICKCSGCRTGSLDASKCTRCGHRSDKHTR